MSCKAIIQEGIRRGEPCKFPPQDDGYCGRHKRNKEFDALVTAGKHPCRQFFRGCNNCVEKQATACADCRPKPAATCGHMGCKNNVKETGYCGKHARDVYRDKEKAEGIRYCDINRGCFSICNPGYASCLSCLEKMKEADNLRYNTLKSVNTSEVNSPTTLCCYCGKSFEKFLTRYNKQSQSCHHCSANQKKNDDKRSARVRNYAAEKKKNIARALKEYKTSATKKKLEFELTKEEFTKLISSPCHYCGKYKEDEVIGIDRVDSDEGYVLKNVVPCCWPCNRMKSDYDKEFFYDHCKSIHMHTSSESHGVTWASCFKRVKKTYNNYKRSCADKRKLEFTLTPYEYERLQDKPCYICGYKRTHVGLDRLDSSKGYTTENTRSCCSPCNLMKCDLAYDEFISHVTSIVEHK
jgi:hypothetical protein